VSEALVSEAPVAEASVASVAEAPVAEAPVAEAPVSEAPVSEAHVSEGAPVSEAPASEALMSEAPVPEASEAPVSEALEISVQVAAPVPSPLDSPLSSSPSGLFMSPLAVAPVSANDLFLCSSPTSAPSGSSPIDVMDSTALASSQSFSSPLQLTEPVSPEPVIHEFVFQPSSRIPDTPSELECVHGQPYVVLPYETKATLTHYRTQFDRLTALFGSNLPQPSWLCSARSTNQSCSSSTTVR